MDDKRFLLAEVKATGDDGAEFTSVLSAPTLDRDLEVIDENAFAPLPAAGIPVHAYHDFHDPVGRGVPYYEDGVLKIKGTFASTPRAQEIRTLVKEGIIGSMSVGFMSANRETGEDGVTHITRAELLEGSFVSVPSNREAAVLMAKDYREAAAKVGARNNVSDSERLQAIHDLSVDNGAKCVTADEERSAEPILLKPLGEFYVGDPSTEGKTAAALEQLELGGDTKGDDEDSAAPVMTPLDQARLAVARAQADLLLID